MCSAEHFRRSAEVAVEVGHERCGTTEPSGISRRRQVPVARSGTRGPARVRQLRRFHRGRRSRRPNPPGTRGTVAESSRRREVAAAAGAGAGPLAAAIVSSAFSRRKRAAGLEFLHVMAVRLVCSHAIVASSSRRTRVETIAPWQNPSTIFTVESDWIRSGATSLRSTASNSHCMSSSSSIFLRSRCCTNALDDGARVAEVRVLADTRILGLVDARELAIGPRGGPAWMLAAMRHEVEDAQAVEERLPAIRGRESRDLRSVGHPFVALRVIHRGVGGLQRLLEHCADTRSGEGDNCLLPFRDERFLL